MAFDEESTHLDVAAGPSAGITTILRHGIGAVKGAPVLLAVYLAAGLLSFVPIVNNIAPIVAAAVAISVAYRVLGGEIRGNPSLVGRIVVAIVSSIIAGFLFLIGLLLFVLPGIYLFVRLRLVVASVVLECAGPIQAIRRSWAITGGHGWTVLGVQLLLAVPGVLLFAGFLYANGALADGSVALAEVEGTIPLAMLVNSVLIGPIAAASNAVMYGLYEPTTQSPRPGEDW